MPDYTFKSDFTYKAELPYDDWVGKRDSVQLSTNAGADEVPFQRWKLFKEAFAPELVAGAIEETAKALGRKVLNCLDPFGGSGTTALTCQFLDVYPLTVEVNPFLADLIEAKLATYDLDRLSRYVRKVFPTKEPAGRKPLYEFLAAPPTFIEPGVNGQYLFNKEVIGRLGQLRQRILSIRDEDSRRLFRALLASVAVPLSNAVISGKGRRYRKNWESRTIDGEDVDAAFAAAISRAIYDIGRHQYRPMPNYTLVRGDARQLGRRIRRPIDLSVFSPPYPNSFDYTDVYNIELWVGGYLGGAEDNRALRLSTLRSHVQIKRDFGAVMPSSQLLKKTIKKLNAVRGELWNRHIPDMISAYFVDMENILRQISNILNRKGRMYVVVGDSRYCGVDVYVADILMELAPQFNLKVVRNEPFRSMRASPQQGGAAELAETLIVFTKT